MPRRSPPPLDAERVRALLAVGREQPPSEGVVERGWLPDTAPPDADTTWAEEPPLVGDDEVQGPGPERPGGRHRPAPRVLTVPLAFRGARLSVSWRAVVAVLVLLVLAALVFVVRVAKAEQAAVPQAVAATGGLVARASVPAAFATASEAASAAASVGTPGGPSGAATTGVASARGSPTTARTLVVDVVGQVARPGVVSVADGGRVSDVLAAAGGALPSADIQRLNLARLVADGEQLFVPRPGENPPAPVGVVGGGAAPSAGSGSAVGGSGSPSGAPVDVNAATLADLDALPGVGPVLAQRILDWRAAHGRFSSVDELGEVSGIGDKLLAQIRPKVRVS